MLAKGANGVKLAINELFGLDQMVHPEYQFMDPRERNFLIKWLLGCQMLSEVAILIIRYNGNWDQYFSMTLKWKATHGKL